MSNNSEYYYPQANVSSSDDESLQETARLPVITEEQYDHYYPPFNSETEYLFVNKCLTLIYGPLPDYAYYRSNDEILNFWIDLEDEYYHIIYNYLIENEYIDDINTPDLDINNYDHVIYMKLGVHNFVSLYFEI